MINLSVNVNKIATLRNARGGNVPNLASMTESIMSFGADSITIHPRPDQRHITKKDVFVLNEIIGKKVEFNIEGFPSDKFIDLVLKIRPSQVTLVPDKENVLTSLEGWDTIKEKQLLKNVVEELRKNKIRTSIFIHPDIKMLEGISDIQSDRVELFTGIYADAIDTIDSYVACSQCANQMGVGVNAGHDLSLNNLPFFVKQIPFLQEVSIGHALISESLYLGLEKTVSMYQEILK
tara:strand:- start:1441 stop:2145 length:705 start_codon:yes stop_codon:yes gene_type:complete